MVYVIIVNATGCIKINMNNKPITRVNMNMNAIGITMNMRGLHETRYTAQSQLHQH